MFFVLRTSGSSRDKKNELEKPRTHPSDKDAQRQAPVDALRALHQPDGQNGPAGDHRRRDRQPKARREDDGHRGRELDAEAARVGKLGGLDSEDSHDLVAVGGLEGGFLSFERRERESERRRRKSELFERRERERREEDD